MSVFQYDRYQSPYTNNISDLMLRQGEIPAQAALRVGDAQAGAALARGNAWAGAAQNVGQAVSSIPAQIQQAQALQQHQKLVQAQIADAQAQAQQREAAARKQQGIEQANQAIDAIMKQSMKPDASTGVISFDRPSFEQGLVSSGMGHLYPTLSETLDKLDASASKRNAEGRSMLAHTLVGIEQAGFTPQSVLTGAAFLKANGAVTKEHLDQVFGAIADDPSPDNVKRVVTALGQQIPEYQELKTAEEKRSADLAKSKADVAKTQADTAKITAEVAGTLPMTPAQKQSAEHQMATLAVAQAAERRMVGQAAESVRHDRALEAANNPLAALVGQGAAAPSGPQAQGATGEEFLKQLPGPIAAEVKAYAEGRRPFPTGFALKSPYFQSLIQMVSQYDPSFDAVNYNSRSKTRNDFTSGKSAQTINALNTVAQHLERLSTAADTLNNSWNPTYNTVANFLSRQTGSKIVTNFETDKKAVVDELTRAWRQSGGSENDIKSWSKVLDSAGSPDQLHGAIGEMGQLLEGKLSALESQFKQGMGTAADIPVITPEARSVLQKLEQRANGAMPKPVSKSLSIDQVKRMAELANVPYAEAKKHAESQGYIVK